MDIDKFIICKINGGLGNQFFNFLNGFYIAKKNNYKILIDETRFIRYKKFKPVLHQIIDNQFYKRISIFEKIKLFFENVQVLKDPDYTKPYFFDEQLLKNYDLKKSILLDGYFQSFNSINTLNLEDFKLILTKDFFDGVYQEKLLNDQNKKCAVHIRRGDFYNESGARKVHGLLTDEYFFKTIEYFETNHKINEFYIFSDDIQYCKSLFKNNNQKFIFIEEMNEIESFKMLTFFSYYIISNSTFSLLASFIAYKKKILKKIICPIKWYKNYSSEDLNLIFDENIFKIVE